MRRSAASLAFSLLPAAALAQTTCTPTQNSFAVSVQPGFIAAQQAFSITAQLCPASSTNANQVITFNIVDTHSNRQVATYRGSTSANGAATATASGLPSDSYEVSAVLPPNGLGGAAQTNAFFNIGGGAGSRALQGPFAFALQGFGGSRPSGYEPQAAVAGAFVTDGDGNITSGEADLNSAAGAYQRIPLTGHYTLDLTGSGTIALQSFIGPLNLSVTTSPVQASAAVQSAVFTSLAPTQLFGSGTLQRQNPAALSPGSSLNGAYVLQLLGETACNAQCASAAVPATPVALTGQFLFNRLATGVNVMTATFDQTTGLTVQPAQVEAGTFTSADAFGRSTSTFAAPLTPASPATFVYYSIDVTHLYALTPIAHTTQTLLSGTGAQ